MRHRVRGRFYSITSFWLRSQQHTRTLSEWIPHDCLVYNYCRWVETWSRVRRQIFCRHSDLASDKSHHECLQVSDDLRMTRCDAGKSLLETMHFDLECQWSGSSSIFKLNRLHILFIVIFLIIFSPAVTV